MVFLGVKVWIDDVPVSIDVVPQSDAIAVVTQFHEMGFYTDDQYSAYMDYVHSIWDGKDWLPQPQQQSSRILTPQIPGKPN